MERSPIRTHQSTTMMRWQFFLLSPVAINE
jgi:hypothetical protein